MKRNIKFSVCVFVLTLCVYLLLNRVFENKPVFKKLAKIKSEIKQTLYEGKVLENNNRKQNIERVCRNGSIFKNSLFKEQKGLKHSLYVPEYNFDYCAIQKTGSTAFKQAVYILQHGIHNTIYNQSRNNVHEIIEKDNKKASHKNRPYTRTVLFSRNPYSRLFSGYIDKVYASSYRQLGCTISKWANPSNSCCQCTTFQQFLDYIIHLAKQGTEIDKHFRPIFLVKCNPCEINIHTLIKQETLVSDMDFFLTTLGVDKEVKDLIVDGMTKNRAETTIPGVLKVIFKDKPSDKNIFKRVERIWKSFQIQGLLSDSAMFFKDDVNNLNVTNIIEIIMKAQKAHPLSESETKVQRQRYLEAAYKDVQAKTIRDIQDIYSADFKLFQYNQLPPGR